MRTFTFTAAGVQSRSDELQCGWRDLRFWFRPAFGRTRICGQNGHQFGHQLGHQLVVGAVLLGDRSANSWLLTPWSSEIALSLATRSSLFRL